MNIAAGIETVASGHSETVRSRAPAVTVANAQGAGQATDSPASPASGAWSFRSSWLSMLASMGAGLDGSSAGADAKIESSASANRALTQPDRTALTAAVTLSISMIPVARHDGTRPENQAANEASLSQSDTRSRVSVAQAGTEIERRDTVGPERNSESAQPAESASSAHSAISKGKAKPESATGATAAAVASATAGDLPLTLLAPSMTSPVAKAAEGPRSAQARYSAGSHAAFAKDFMNPIDSGLTTVAGHATPTTSALPQATGIGRSSGEDFDGAGAASSADMAVERSSERTRPHFEESEPAKYSQKAWFRRNSECRGWSQRQG